MKPVQKWLKRTRCEGFTLIEIMIVLAVMAFGLLSLSAMQIYAMRGGNRGRHASQAAAVAEAQMESLMRTTWTALPATAGWTAPLTVNHIVQSDAGNGAEQAYTMEYRVADAVVGATRTVDVRVSWVEPGGDSRFISLSSIRYNRENL